MSSPGSVPAKLHHKQQHTRATPSIQRTRISINCYDLLPPGRISSFLWQIGSSLLHTGVVIEEREYAYGGHDTKGISGVYYTQVGTEPTGGVFRCEILQGYTLQAPKEIKRIVRKASHKFQGTQWNLLSNNCNHFTHYLCKELTGRPAPSWINRAANIGFIMPCVVPRTLIKPPDAETAEGDLLQSNEPHIDEGTAMLSSQAPDLDRRNDEDDLAE